jgi:bacterioferritin
MSFLLSEDNRKRIIEALNKGVGREIAAIVQYQVHHVVAEGLESPAIIELFEDTGQDEMRHMEQLSERINYLGGEPTTKPWPIKTGGDLKKMIQDDLDTEYEACRLYKEVVKLCADIGDTTSRLMMEKILAEEEEHADRWETLLQKTKRL